MKTFQIFVSLIATILLIIFCQSLGHTAEVDVIRLCNAIGRAENSVKYPYGIKSINTHGDKVYAKKICINSIKNAHKRWIKAGMPEDFIVFMGRRFSPPASNPNWVRLVTYFYNQGVK